MILPSILCALFVVHSSTTGLRAKEDGSRNWRKLAETGCLTTSNDGFRIPELPPSKVARSQVNGELSGSPMGLGDRVSLFDMSLDTSGTDDEASEEKEEKGKGKEKEEEGKFESESDGQESTKNPFHALPEPNWSAWSALPKRIFTRPSSEKGGKLRRTID